MGAVSSAASDLSDYDEDPTEATLIYETVNIDEIKKDSRCDSQNAPKSLNPKKSKKVRKMLLFSFKSLSDAIFRFYISVFAHL